MYLHRHDETEAVALWIFVRSTPEEFDEHFEHLREIATWSAKGGKRVAALLIAQDFKLPDARRRSELTRLTEAPGYDPYVAFVVPNIAIRAGLSMFGWLQKAPRYEMDYFATSAKALPWLEQKRGERLERLAEFVEELRVPFERETGSRLP